MLRQQCRETCDSLGMENSVYYIRKLLTGKCIFGNDGRQQKALKSSKEITKLVESTSVKKSFAKMGGPELA